jgi:signal transduction histidine kinase
VEAELLRIVQEALNNARRHSEATIVTVDARVVGELLHVLVADNGRGFAADAPMESGFGLTNMRERAAIIGGELTIQSNPNDGTRVAVDVPLSAEPVGRAFVR